MDAFATRPYSFPISAAGSFAKVEQNRWENQKGPELHPGFWNGCWEAAFLLEWWCFVDGILKGECAPDMAEMGTRTSQRMIRKLFIIRLIVCGCAD